MFSSSLDYKTGPSYTSTSNTNLPFFYCITNVHLRQRAGGGVEVGRHSELSFGARWQADWVRGRGDSGLLQLVGKGVVEPGEKEFGEGIDEMVAVEVQHVVVVSVDLRDGESEGEGCVRRGSVPAECQMSTVLCEEELKGLVYS
ncbi:hypothetical protein E2C01_081785 [Portunus trituberculatus]|uniref:Uncharacterized protein n=1 Tax=Portunus trituberculatus TaxID=210409 RepID=A0A5B7ISS3_PORTR|nr:hypothetical protein [Portunus trituberculatus]